MNAQHFEQQLEEVCARPQQITTPIADNGTLGNSNEVSSLVEALVQLDLNVPTPDVG
jgi:hypothetical protein